MKEFFIKDISPDETFEPIKKRNGVYVVTFMLSEENGVKRVATTRYASEPDTEQAQADYAAWRKRHDNLLLSQAKRDKLAEIFEYNTSENVDGFLFNGTRHWLSLEARKAAKLSTDAHITLGHETTEQYLDGKIYTIPCQTLLLMLAQLEVYALQCYNNALCQKAEVEAMTDIEEVQRYDVRNGYPEQLDFII